MDLYPTTKVIFDRRKKAGPKTQGSVELEVYFQRKRKWISTGVKVLPRHWDDRKRVVGRIDAVDLNLRIDALEGNVLGIIRKLMVDGKPFTWGNLDAIGGNDMGGKESFVSFVKKRVEERSDIKESTKKNHRKLINALVEFDKIKRYSDLTKANILLYDEWLRQRKDYTQSTIASYHKFLKIYVYEALGNDSIQSNPYESIKIDRGKSKIRKYLTEKELGKIESASLQTKSLERTRDLFLFQCYTGLAYADMAKFDFHDTVEKDGHFVLHDTRIKTGEDFYIILLPAALKILRKYDFQLPVISNQQYNMRLKIVADAAGIDKKLTSHMGRHTYASLCINSGVRIEVLAKMMGHTDIKTTQIYAGMVNTTVEAAYEKLITKLGQTEQNY